MTQPLATRCFSGAHLADFFRMGDLYTQTCFVTGATAGIGWFTAKALAKKGARVILHGRSPVKLEQCRNSLRSDIPEARLETAQADFEDLRQVQTLIQQLDQWGGRIDVLINNAGAFFNRRHITPLGVEKTFLVNHLAAFLLTNELLAKGLLSPAARIVVVTSDAYKMGSIYFNDLAFRRRYFGMQAYARSKLANLLFSYELARRLEGTGMTVNAVHPGHTASDIWKTNFGVIGPVLKWFMSLFARTPEQAAETLIYLATSNDVAGVSGRYFEDCQAVETTGMSHDVELAMKLWEVSEQILNEGLQPMPPSEAI
jgi:NAD(P)-dependent dehydrogenase (short-subunit alcohol dehydrogenase family)